jgi:hypothetical protein
MNIPTSVIVVVLVAAWLVVLVPMIARRRDRVPQAPASGAGMRVLRRASASLRRPRRMRAGTSPRVRDRESVTAEEALVSVGAGPQHEPTDAAEEWAAAQADQRHRVATMSAPSQEDPGVLPGQVPADGPVPADGHIPADGYVPNPDGSSDDRRADGADVPVAAEADTSAVRRVARSIPAEVDEDEWVASMPAGASPPEPPSEDVKDEHLRPIPRRSGRGGYDPEAAEATRAYRYRQRRRITLVLLLATVAFSLAGALIVSFLGVGAGVSLVLLAGYLAYLRRQVRIEAAIRQRRMERLQRARQIRPEFGRAAGGQVQGAAAGHLASTVYRGREVVDLDDDDPGFDDLEQSEHMTYRRAVGQ